MTPEISSVAGLRSGIAAFIGDSFSHGRSALGDPFGKAILLGFGCPDGVRVGSGVSEVQEAFVATIATTSPEYRRWPVRFEARPSNGVVGRDAVQWTLLPLLGTLSHV